MRLGHDAMYRQQDMALDDALEYLRSQLTLDLLDRGHRSRACRRSSRSASPNGRDADGDRRSSTRRGSPKRRPRSSRRERMKASAERPPRAPREGEARRRRGEDRRPARARQADRARADRPARRPGHLRRDRHPRPARTSPSARWRARRRPADGVITGWGDVDGRPCAIAAYDFTVMAGSMGMTGEFKVGRLREMALRSGCR